MNAVSTTSPRAAWLLVDGLPFWLVEKAVSSASEHIPTIAGLFNSARVVGLEPLAPNCQTPSSLAALFSKSTSEETGLFGFDLPDFSRPDVISTKAAFRSFPEKIDLFWETAAANGLDVWLSHIPFVRPSRISENLRYYSNGFKSPLIAPAVLSTHDAASLFGCEIVEGIGEASWCVVDLSVLAGAPPGQETLGYALRRSIADSTRIVFTGAWTVDRRENKRNFPHEIEPAIFMGTGLQKAYRSGQLGKTLSRGGLGDAEFVFVQALQLLSRRYSDEWLTNLAEAKAGLIVSYQPVIDLALHELTGYLLSECGHWTQERENIVWPMVLDLLSDFDSILDRTRSLLQDEDKIIVTSDHGMSPIDVTVRPNVFFLQNGWLELTPTNAIDPTKSVCFYHPAENGLLCLNQKILDERGIDTETFCEVITSTLSRETGRNVSIKAWPELERHVSPPAYLSGRHFLDGGRLVQLKADTLGRIKEPSVKTGEHVLMNGSQELIGTIIDLSPKAIGFSQSLIPTDKVADLLALGQFD